MFWAVIASVFNMLAFICFVDKILQLYALKLGAEPRTFGMIVFCLQWAALARLPAATRVERRGKKKTLITEWGLCGFAGLLILLAPQMQVWFGHLAPAALQPVLTFLHPEQGFAILCLLVGATAFNLLHQGGSTGWFPLLQDVVPPNVRGRYFGMLRTIWQTITKIFLLFAAWFQGDNPELWHFQVLLSIGLVCTIARVGCVTQIPELPSPKPKAEPLWELLAIPLRNKQFRNFLLFTSLYFLAWGMVEPFRLVYLSELGFGSRVLTLSVAAASLGAVVALFFWGKLSDRHGGRPVFGLCNFSLVLLTAAWWGVHSFAPEAGIGETWGAWGFVLGLFFVMGAFESGFGLAQTRQIMEIVPRHHQAVYFSMNTIAILGPMGLGAFLAGSFTQSFRETAPQWFGLGIDAYQWMFAGSLLLLAVPLLLNGKVALQGETPTRELVRQAFSGRFRVVWPSDGGEPKVEPVGEPAPVAKVGPVVPVVPPTDSPKAA